MALMIYRYRADQKERPARIAAQGTEGIPEFL